MLIDFNSSFEKEISYDDVCRTVINHVEGINIGEFINLHNKNTHGYDSTMIFTHVILAKTLFGYVFTRHLESLCKTNVRFMTISQN